jgi:hypothetical protein
LLAQALTLSQDFVPLGELGISVEEVCRPATAAAAIRGAASFYF